MPEPSVHVVRRDQFSDSTAQTSGLHREVAFDSRNPDGKVLSAFLSTVLHGAATGAHHHGDQETILYVLEGTARYRWATEGDPTYRPELDKDHNGIACESREPG